MGLDVYLYRYENFEETKRLKDEYHKFEKQQFDNLGREATQEDLVVIEAAVEAKAAEIGLDEWGETEDGERVELESKLHPDSMFKIGYMRSSYNSGGINSILRSMVGKDLYYAFRDDDNEEYCFKPDWPKAKERLLEISADLADSIQRLQGCHTHVSARQGFATFSLENMADVMLGREDGEDTIPTNADEALLIFMKRYDEERPRNEQRRPGGEELNYGPFEVLEFDMDFDLTGYPVKRKSDVVKNITSDHHSILNYDPPLKIRAVIDGMEILDGNGVLRSLKKMVEISDRYQPDKQGMPSGLDPNERMEWIRNQPTKTDEQIQEELACMAGIDELYARKAFVIIDKSEDDPAVYIDPEHPFGGGWYRGRGGEFMFSSAPMCRMIIKGGDQFIRQGTGTALHLVYQSDLPEEEREEPYGWYKNSIEVAVEMCEWVIEQPDRDKYYFHWSG